MKKPYKILYALKRFFISAMTFILYGPSILVLLHQNSSERVKHVLKLFAELKLKHLIKYFLILEKTVESLHKTIQIQYSWWHRNRKPTHIVCVNLCRTVKFVKASFSPWADVLQVNTMKYQMNEHSCLWTYEE